MRELLFRYSFAHANVQSLKSEFWSVHSAVFHLNIYVGFRIFVFDILGANSNLDRTIVAIWLFDWYVDFFRFVDPIFWLKYTCINLAPWANSNVLVISLFKTV